MKTKQTMGAAKFTSKGAAYCAFNKAQKDHWMVNSKLADVNSEIADTWIMSNERHVELKISQSDLQVAERVALNNLADIYYAAKKQGFHITTNLFGHNATRDLASANCD